MFLLLLGRYLGLKLMGRMASICLTAKLFPKQLYCNICSFSTFLPTLDFVSLCEYSHLSSIKQYHIVLLICISLMTMMLSSHVFITYSYIFFGEVTIQSFTNYFLINLFVLLLLSSKSSL